MPVGAALELAGTEPEGGAGAGGAGRPLVVQAVTEVGGRGAPREVVVEGLRAGHGYFCRGQRRAKSSAISG